MDIPHAIALENSELSRPEVLRVVELACSVSEWDAKKVLVIVPDATRTAPVGEVFRALHTAVAKRCRAFDVMVALGTHPPMTEQAICERLEMTGEERQSEFSAVNFFNHEWDNPEALTSLGSIPADEIKALSGGLFAMDVPVSINRRLLDYDRIIII